MDKETDKDKNNVDEVVLIDKVDAVKGVVRSLEFTSPPQKAARHEVVNERKVKCFDSLHTSLKMLCRYVDKHLTNGEGIFVQFDFDIFGKPFELYVHADDIVAFCELEPISGNCIVVYMW
ncbi:uncharacterized protein LOC131017143 [Salvia miltiorrhiza]|uniref:uncharacterized protein LOC131017143 n=1 Tax=Salvia miltiorrhiza TaxID=226208 RepID=UPI0025ABD770|nr:uncharacterized protein LOC131017143 [Salvia miltiorrhiza]